MVLQRHEINEKDTWDLSTIYSTDQAWEEALKEASEKIESASQYEGHLLDSADSLLTITEFTLEMERQVEKLYVYAHMKNDQDTREAKYQEYYAKAMTLYSQLEQAFSFYEPEFMELSEEQYKHFLESQPKLQVYQHYFDKLLQEKEHVLEKSLVRQVKHLRFWIMQISSFLMYWMMMVKRFSYLTEPTHV